MKATSEGQRLKVLREGLGLTQDQLAQFANVARQSIIRAEGNRVKWRSSDLREGLMRALCMTYEQLRSYLSGELSLRDAIVLAEPSVTAMLRAQAEKRERDALLEDVFRRASAQEEMLPATKVTAPLLFSAFGKEVPMSTMVRRLLALNAGFRDHIDETMRAIRSDLAAPK